MKRLQNSLAAALILVLLTGCPNPGNPDPLPSGPTVTIKFNSQGGSSVADQVLPTGSLISTPTAPTLSGNTFSGWYKEPACTTPWSFSSDTANADLTLYAKWSAMVTVTFDSQGGTAVAPQTLGDGGLLSTPTPPTKSAWIFSGWYKEASCLTPWNFSADTASSGLVIYAFWISEGMTISGPVTTDMGSSTYDEGRVIAQQSDGKVVAAGFTMASGSGDFGLVRYNLDGTLDSSFGTGGKVFTDFAGGSDDPCAISIQNDGKILVLGYASTGGGDFGLVRYNSDGSLDSSFGTGGKLTVDFGSGTEDRPAAMVLLPGGKILAGGRTGSYTTNSEDMALVMVDSAGALDGTFGTGGKVVQDLSLGKSEAINSLTMDSNGKILAGGYSGLYASVPTVSNVRDFLVARFTAAGALDSTFNSSGYLIEGFNSGSYSSGTFSYITSVVLDSSGSVLVSGSTRATYNTGNVYISAIRLSSTGAFDASFDGDGKLSVFNSMFAKRMVIQSDGKFVILGDISSKFTLIRFNSNGTYDTGFGIGGVLTTALTGSFTSMDLKTQGNGKYLVAGTFGSVDYVLNLVNN